MKMKLGDLAEGNKTGIILSRIQVRGTCVADGINTELVRVLMPKAIRYGRIDLDEVPEIVVKKGTVESRLTESGDIIVKLTTPYEFAAITQDERGLVVPSYCGIIRRVDEKLVNMNYLIAYLNTDYAKKLMSAGVAASTTAMLKMRDLLDIEVPLPPLKEQRMLGDLYLLSSEKQEVMRKMIESESVVMDNLIVNAAVEAMKDA